MYDWIMRASAKGVLLFPEECLPKGMSMEDVANEWARFDGVIMIKQPKTGTALPQADCKQLYTDWYFRTLEYAVEVL